MICNPYSLSTSMLLSYVHVDVQGEVGKEVLPFFFFIQSHCNTTTSQSDITLRRPFKGNSTENTYCSSVKSVSSLVDPVDVHTRTEALL